MYISCNSDWGFFVTLVSVEDTNFFNISLKGIHGRLSFSDAHIHNKADTLQCTLLTRCFRVSILHWCASALARSWFVRKPCNVNSSVLSTHWWNISQWFSKILHSLAFFIYPLNLVKQCQHEGRALENNNFKNKSILSSLKKAIWHWVPLVVYSSVIG